MKFTVIAEVEGECIPPYVEANDINEAIITAISAMLKYADEDNRELARKWWFEDIGYLNDTRVLAVLPGHLPIVGGWCKPEDSPIPTAPDGRFLTTHELASKLLQNSETPVVVPMGENSRDEPAYHFVSGLKVVPIDDLPVEGDVTILQTKE